MKSNKFSKNLVLFLVLTGLLLIPVFSVGLFRYTGEKNVLSFSDIRNPLSDISMPKFNLGNDKGASSGSALGDSTENKNRPSVDLPSNFIITKYVAN